MLEANRQINHAGIVAAKAARPVIFLGFAWFTSDNRNSYSPAICQVPVGLEIIPTGNLVFEGKADYPCRMERIVFAHFSS